MLAGRLGDFSLLDVLRLLAETGKRGTLQVRGGASYARLEIDGGHVTAAALESGDGAEGAAPVPEQVVDVLFELLFVTGGEFRFDGPAQQPRPEVPVGPDPLVVEARSRHERWPDLLTGVGGPDAVPELATPTRDEPITLTMDQWRLLARIDGHRPVGELLSSGRQGRWAALGLLHTLCNEGVVAVPGPAVSSSATAVPEPVALQPPGPPGAAPRVLHPTARPEAAARAPVGDLERLIRGVEQL